MLRMMSQRCVMVRLQCCYTLEGRRCGCWLQGGRKDSFVHREKGKLRPFSRCAQEPACEKMQYVKQLQAQQVFEFASLLSSIFVLFARLIMRSAVEGGVGECEPVSAARPHKKRSLLFFTENAKQKITESNTPT